MSDYFLADDLSGVLDAAAAFHHVGKRRVRVVLSPDDWTFDAPDEVVGVTTETRNAAPQQAAQVVARALAHGQAQGGRLLYKKIDSTLRGAVAAELAALAAALPQTRILFAPSNPRVGRTVREGVLQVHGVPVAQTEFGADPVSPVKDSEIRRLLGGVAAERVTIPDTIDEADLAAAVARMSTTPGAWVGVGSGALARPVAAGFARPERGSDGLAEKIAPGPTLMVCGSAHAGNRAQATELARERGVSWHVVRIEAPGAAVAAVTAGIQARRGGAMLLEENRGVSSEALRVVATAAAQIVTTTGIARVFVTGGETAYALCQALQIRELVFGLEVEPGLSLSWARRPEGRMLLAVKPGGFGDALTWVRAWDALGVT